MVVLKHAKLLYNENVEGFINVELIQHFQIFLLIIYNLGLYDEKNDSLVYFQAVLVRNYLKSFSMNEFYFFFKISVFLWFVFIYGIRLVLLVWWFWYCYLWPLIYKRERQFFNSLTVSDNMSTDDPQKLAEIEKKSRNSNKKKE